MLRLMLAAAAFGLVAPMPGQAPMVRDSAGIQIVDNPSMHMAPIAFTLGAAPRLELVGTRENSDSQFYAYRGARATGLRLRDGRIAVANGTLDQTDRQHPKFVTRIMFFDSAGKLLSTVTYRPPFMSIIGLCETRGDTLLLNDTNGHVVGVADRWGAVVRTISITGGTRAESCFADGTFLIMDGHDRGNYTAKGPPLTRMVSKRLDGTVVHDFGWFPNQSLSPGSPVPSVLVRGSLLYFATSETSEVRLYTPLGVLARIIRTNDSLLPVTNEQLARGEGAPTIASTGPINHASAAATWPAYGPAMTDETGRIWLSDYDRSGYTSRMWTAFDVDGKVIGRLAIPIPPNHVTWHVDAFYANEVQVTIVDNVSHGYRLAFYPLVRVP